MRAAQQILASAVLGTKAYDAGISVPCRDIKMMAMIGELGREIGCTPNGEASTIAILNAWSHAWHAANAAV